MLDYFLITHGPTSDEVNKLIVPEETLNDRTFNLYIITKCDNTLSLLKSLQRKKSLSGLSDNLLGASQSNIETISNSGMSLNGVDTILSDPSLGVELALEILKNVTPLPPSQL